MTPQLRARARQRWAAWLAWFKDKGYHPRDPGSNYQAGYLTRGDADRDRAGRRGRRAVRAGALEVRRRRAVGQGHGRRAVGRAACSTAATGTRAGSTGRSRSPSTRSPRGSARRTGSRSTAITPWLDSVLRRHVYALTPVIGCGPAVTSTTTHAYMSPQVLVLDAIALGDASPDDKRWAKGELSRLKLTDKDSLLYDALATLGDPPALVPRASWPTWYQATGPTATLFARTSWDDRAIWFVAACAQTSGLDHREPQRRQLRAVARRRGSDRRSVAVRLAVDPDRQRADRDVQAAAAQLRPQPGCRGARTSPGCGPPRPRAASSPRAATTRTRTAFRTSKSDVAERAPRLRAVAQRRWPRRVAGHLRSRDHR